MRRRGHLNPSCPHPSRATREADGHRFFLIMGHDHKGRAGAFLEYPSIQTACPDAAFLSSAPSGSSSKSRFGRFCQGARQGHPLALAPRNLMGFALRKFVQSRQPQHFRHALRLTALLRVFAPQAKRNIFPNRQMRKQRIGLEHHVYGALVRRHRAISWPARPDGAG